MRKQFIYSVLTLLFLFGATALIIFYGYGYRFGFDEGKAQLTKTGLLVATSIPNGAQVFINGHLNNATNSTLNLTPGEYTVKIYKDGYFPWEKKVNIEKEVVTKVEALLLPTTPKLESITRLGILNPVVDPSGTKIAYQVASQSARKNGIYVFDLQANIVFSLQGAAKQIADDTTDILSNAQLMWSPDGEELIASTPAQTTYLLRATQMNQAPRDVTTILQTVQQEWSDEKEEKELSRLEGLKPTLRKIITDNFTVLAWSPDDTKILYQASQSADLPLVIKPRLPGVDTLRETRTIEQRGIYVYDIKEDANMKILDPLEAVCADTLAICNLPIHWFPDSAHLVYVKDKRINIMEADGTNNTTIYAGPFIGEFAVAWPDGSKIVVLTDLNNPNILPNLYTISLK